MIGARDLRGAVVAAVAAAVQLPSAKAGCVNGTWVNATDDGSFDGAVGSAGEASLFECEPEPEPEPYVQITVSLSVVPGMVFLWGTCALGLTFIYSKMREKHEKAYERAKVDGTVPDYGQVDFHLRQSRKERKAMESRDPAAESKDNANTAAEDSADAAPVSAEEAEWKDVETKQEEGTIVDRMCEFIFISIGDAENTKEMGLDAAMYLAHLQLCSAFWTIQSCTTGLIMVTLYQVFGVNSGMDMYSWSYANLREEYRWLTVVASTWMIATTIVFAIYRGKIMDRLKLRVGYGDLRSTTTLWFENVPNTLSEQQIHEWFVARYPKGIDSTRLALDVYELGKNIRTSRRIILKINATVEKLERKQASLILAGNAIGNAVNPLSRGPPVRSSSASSSSYCSACCVPSAFWRRCLLPRDACPA